MQRLVGGELDTYDLEKRYFKKDGSLVWVLLTVSVVRRPGGEPRFFMVQIQDISRRKAAEADQRWLAALVESMDDALVGLDPLGRVLSWNPGAERLYGYSAQEMVGQSNERLVPAGRKDRVREALRGAPASESVFHFDEQRLRKDGTVVDVAMTAARVRDAAGETIGWSLVVRDVTEANRTRAALARQLEVQDSTARELSRAKVLLEATFAHIGDGVALLDAQRRILLANDAYGELLSLPSARHEGLGFEEFARHLQGMVANPEEVADALAPPVEPLRTRTTDFLRLVPTKRWLRRAMTPIESGGEWLYLVVWRDVTAERDLIAEREREISTDELTGIPNRRAAQARAREVLGDSKPVCIALLDIDHFKRVNDAHGHTAGDEVLRRVAAALAGQARGTDLVARWGGEEFIAILSSDLAGATAFCERALQAVAGLVLPEVGSITISAGVSLLEGEFEQTLEQADGALYEAKAKGRNRVVTA
ncbi:MAG: sensor domain-containing diguanylate cyclase [Myxococcales bacterium]|nr:MAG: sensor domain-containing diguanylate cyclase [Myxococcales bacterium]